VVFLGLAEEYRTFKCVAPRARHHEPRDFLDMARVIKGSKCFVGGQSSPWWVAEGLGHPRCLAVFPVAPNCIPMTCSASGKPTGFDATTTGNLERIVKRLMR
jgi:ADP-heptose:LPS heptosyltransferase